MNVCSEIPVRSDSALLLTASESTHRFSSRGDREHKPYGPGGQPRLSPTRTRAAFLLITLLAPGAAGNPVADRHSASSASRHAVIRSATPQRDGRDTGDRNACRSADAAGESHRCERNCASRARREARPHPGPRARSPISPGRGSPTLVRVPIYYPPQ